MPLETVVVPSSTPFLYTAMDVPLASLLVPVMVVDTELTPELTKGAEVMGLAKFAPAVIVERLVGGKADIKALAMANGLLPYLLSTIPLKSDLFHRQHANCTGKTQRIVGNKEIIEIVRVTTIGRCSHGKLCVVVH